MTALSPSHGSQAEFQIGTSGTPGTPVLIYQYVDSSSMAQTRDKAEVSAFRNVIKAFVAGLGDATLPFQGPWDANIDAILSGLMLLASPANTVVWGYGPTGIGAGLGILYSGTGILTKYEMKSGITAANNYSAEIQNSGPYTRTVQ